VGQAPCAETSHRRQQGTCSYIRWCGHGVIRWIPFEYSSTEPMFCPTLRPQPGTKPLADNLLPLLSHHSSQWVLRGIP
jgi:hypothetical protein